MSVGILRRWGPANATVCGAAQLPQLELPPHPFDIVPQFLPSPAHVVGVQRDVSRAAASAAGGPNHTCAVDGAPRVIGRSAAVLASSLQTVAAAAHVGGAAPRSLGRRAPAASQVPPQRLLDFAPVFGVDLAGSRHASPVAVPGSLSGPPSGGGELIDRRGSPCPKPSRSSPDHPWDWPLPPSAFRLRRTRPMPANTPRGDRYQAFDPAIFQF